MDRLSMTDKDFAEPRFCFYACRDHRPQLEKLRDRCHLQIHETYYDMLNTCGFFDCSAKADFCICVNVRTISLKPDDDEQRHL